MTRMTHTGQKVLDCSIILHLAQQSGLATGVSVFKSNYFILLVVHVTPDYSKYVI